MKFNKIIPYKLRRVLSLAAIAGAPLLPASCCKVEQEQQPTHDVVVEFDIGNFDKKLDVKNIQNLLQDKNTRYIYLSATNHWKGWGASSISALRRAALQPCIELSPKVRGCGNFDFDLGEASKIPTDSLWIVKNGWTINKGR